MTSQRQDAPSEVERLQAANAEQRAVNAELLAALRRIAYSESGNDYVWGVARAALANVEGT